MNNLLGTLLEQSGKDVTFDGVTLSCLCHANDQLLMTEMEQDLQYLLDILATWWDRNMINIKTDKQRLSISEIKGSNIVFKCKNEI